eukprot:359189-Chlamydomonas_euryale.AAC.6
MHVHGSAVPTRPCDEWREVNEARLSQQPQVTASHSFSHIRYVCDAVSELGTGAWPAKKLQLRSEQHYLQPHGYLRRFVVDFFGPASREVQGCDFWFLTHFHADHYKVRRGLGVIMHACCWVTHAFDMYTAP